MVTCRSETDDDRGKREQRDVDETVFLVYNYPCTQSVEYEPFMTSIIVLPISLPIESGLTKDRFTMRCHGGACYFDPPT